MDGQKEARISMDGRAIKDGRTRDPEIMLHHRDPTVSRRQNVVMRRRFVVMSVLSRITMHSYLNAYPKFKKNILT